MEQSAMNIEYASFARCVIIHTKILLLFYFCLTSVYRLPLSIRFFVLFFSAWLRKNIYLFLPQFIVLVVHVRIVRNLRFVCV